MNIWQADDKPELEALTDEMIEMAEKAFGVKLPAGYLNILREQNGGYLQYESFPTSVPTSWADDHINVDRIFGIGKDSGIMDTAYLIEEWSLPKDVVLLSGDGHTWVALDYRKTRENPPVIFIEVDDEKVIELASDFDAFLSGLYIEEEEPDDIVEENPERVWTIEEMKIAFLANDGMEIAYAWDYLSVNPTGHAELIETSLVELLRHSDLEIKQLAANSAYEFNEQGLLSTKCIDEIVAVIAKDPEIAYYNEMFFE